MVNDVSDNFVDRVVISELLKNSVSSYDVWSLKQDCQITQIYREILLLCIILLLLCTVSI
jgi:hypothetical protein